MKTKIAFLLSLLIYSVAFAQDEYDTNFANNGVYIQEGIDFGGTDYVALQDDKIIGTTYYQDLNTGAVLRNIYRLNAAGTLDTSFGDNGVFSDNPNIVFQTTGALIVEGSAIYTVTSAVLPGANRTDMTITKLTANGILDASFGVGGYTTIPQPSDTDFSEGIDFKFDSSGNIIAGGLIKQTSTGESLFVVAKFTSIGALDTTFGVNGIYQHPIISGFEQNFMSLLVNDDDTIIIIGNLIDQTTFSDRATILKLAANGIVDTSFGTSGLYTTNYSETRASTRANLLSDGSILMYGLQLDDQNSYSGYSERITANGVLDTSYGNNGIGDAFIGGQDIVVNYAQMIPREGKYILIGDVLDLGPFIRSTIITRLNNDGSFDASYGTNGTIIFDSPISEFPSLRGRHAVANEEAFFIATEAEDTNFNLTGSIVKLLGNNLGLDEFGLNTSDVTLVPNPVNASSILQFSSKNNENGELIITNTLGQKIVSRTVKIFSGENTFPLNTEIQNLSKGIYHINLFVNNARVVSVKFIK